MDVFAPDFGFERSTNGSSVLVNQNIPGTTIGSTNNYIYGPGGIPRNPQSQGLASSLGQGAISPNDGGVAVGAYAGALASGCSAFGYHAQAKVYSALALGDQAAALAYRSIAMGRCANAAGNNSIAIGTLSKATGPNGISIGNSSISGTGADAISIGYRVSATGSKSICIGNTSSASGSSDVVIGYNNNISGFNVVAIGLNIQTAQNNCVLLGTGAIPVSANSFVAGAPGLFQQGPILDVYFGQGPRVFLAGGTVMGAYTIHGEEAGGGSTGGANTNLNRAGGNLNLAGGRSTGSGIGGSVNIQVCGSFGSNETLNSLSTALSVAPSGITASLPMSVSSPFTVNSVGAGSTLILNCNAGQSRIIRGTTAYSARWEMYLGNGDPESGANAGSNFYLIAYSDAGSWIDNPIGITRAAGGHIVLNRAVDVLGSLTNLNGSLIVTNGAGSSNIFMNAPAGNFRDIWSQTSGVNRWLIRMANGAESGGNAGADLVIYAFADSGALIDAPFGIDRKAGGTISLNRPVTINGNLFVSGSISAGAPVSYGTYGPAFADAGSTNSVFAHSAFKWMRIGNVVHVAGGVNFGTIVAGTAFSFYITLPIASNITSIGDLAGVMACISPSNIGGAIFGDNATDRAQCFGYAGSGGDNATITFTYIVQ